ncbi:unnamed protein product [Pylaiella littoralis]
MERGYRYLHPKRRRHRGIWRNGVVRRSRAGSPLVRLTLAGLSILLSFWAGTVLQVSRALPPSDNQAFAPTDRDHLAAAAATAAAENAAKSKGRAGVRLASPKSREEEAGGGPIAQPTVGGGGGRAGRPPMLRRSVYTSVDYKGGDIHGVGPLEAETAMECRSLCVRDGRCLKWSLQEKDNLCWLKGEGGTRNEGAVGITSGIVRNKQDETVKTPNYGKESPPPPELCCPEGAAEPPPGVHALDLWDDQPGSDWTSSYPLGNGHLGAMLGMGTFEDTIFVSDGSLWAGKGKTAGRSGFPQSPDRYDMYQEFQKAREALLNGEYAVGQEAAGHMPTAPDGFVSSFEYAGEVYLEFGGGGAGSEHLDREQSGGPREGIVDGYIRHLHLNNGTAEVAFGSVGGVEPNASPVRLLHRREVFASNVDGVLAMRLSCKEEESGKGCLSFAATPKRGGKPLFTEAWELPPPRGRQLDNTAAGTGEGEAGQGGGAYVGLFRPPGGSGEKSELGFHLCAAVIPMGGGGAGAVAEEFLDQGSQRHHPEGPRGESPADALTLAKLGNGPGERPSRVPPGPARGEPRHRAALSADDARAEAMVLVSVVTEDDPETEDEKERRLHRRAAGAGDFGSEWTGDEEGRGWWENGSERDPSSWKDQSEEDRGEVRGGGGGRADIAHRRQREGAPWRDGTRRRVLGGEERDTPAGAKRERGGSTDNEKQRELRRRCLERVEAAAGLGFERLRRRHTDDVEAMFDRVDFSLGSSSDGTGVVERKTSGARSLSSSGSCVAGLPVRTRVSRSGKACMEGGEEAEDPAAKRVKDNVKTVAGRTVVDDGLIELMYHYGRYLMISGSRPGGRPLNLQGIWANSLKAKWEGDYHMNINLQMNYWGAHTAGLPECAAPLVPFVEALSDGGRQTAHRQGAVAIPLIYYRAPGWVSHANTDRWGGTAAHGDAVWALCPTCGAWMALHLWEAYEFTRDASLLLSSVVPVLEGAVTFFLEYMVLADDGLGDGTCLLTGPSTSPENSLPAVKKNVPEKKVTAGTNGGKGEKPPPDVVFPFVAMSPAIDVSIVRQLLENFIQSSREAVLRLGLLQNGGPPSLLGLPPDWTAEDAPRLFNPPGPVAWEEEQAYPDHAAPPSDESFASVSGRLRRLSERSEEALSKLPNQGRPSIGGDGMLREYRGVDTSDLPDPGHRHSSGLWALYPGFQIAPGEDKDLFDAAAATVQYKLDKGGGHTAWSRAWLVNLRARLFQGAEALDSLRGVLRDQCVGSMFSLHPPLTKTPGKELAECLSCFGIHQEGNRVRKNKEPKKIGSGLVTADGAVFQIDGNLGFLAGVNEMLLQSQYWHPRKLREEGSSPRAGSRRTQFSSSPPAVGSVEIRLLPALPDDWPAGTFRGLRTRGGYEVDVKWDNGEITSGSLRPVTSSAAATGENDNGRSARVEANPLPPCRVLSRTRLKAVLVVDGREVSNVARFTSDDEGDFEGGVLWFSVGVEALQPGEEARFLPIDS